MRHSTYISALPVTVMACLLPALLPACVPIGVVPWSEGGQVRHIQARNFPRNIDDKTASLLTPGQTTRKDVVLKLGEPDFVYDDERKFIYEGEITSGGREWKMGVLTPVGIGSGPWYPFEYERYRLTILFDGMGRVESSAFTRHKQVDRHERIQY